MISAPPFRIDTHAHVFPAQPRLVPRRRYTPRGAARLDDYLGLLDSTGLSHGVLVQPSFLGTDNSHLIACLRVAPERLRGIAVIDQTITDRDLTDLAAAGVVGIRLNLLDAPVERYRTAAWQSLFERVTALNWIIEVQALGTDLPEALACVWPCGAPLVIDHFGRPDPSRGAQDRGFRELVRLAEQERLWIKLSAPYRTTDGLLEDHARRLLELFGPGRLLWGSDWPWTQHEEGMAFWRSLDWLERWVPDAESRDRVLGETPARLFGIY